LYDELPFFKPKKSVFMVNPDEQRGIHCRFGMRSVAAEAHFDGSRNAVVQLGGLRRWIMAHPQECKNMHMLTGDHPSSRHTAIDWSKPDTVKFPDFKKLKGHEVILQPGDFLYVPTFWLHAIVSIDVNYQCNTRSGSSSHFDRDIEECGFGG
jgi:ribosomal protein L16 Arg81 hydroxylase